MIRTTSVNSLFESISEWQLLEVEKGLQEMSNGLLTTHDDVVAYWEAKILTAA